MKERDESYEHRGDIQKGETYIFYLEAECPGCSSTRQPRSIARKELRKHKSGARGSNGSDRSDSGISDVNSRTSDRMGYSFNVNNFVPSNTTHETYEKITRPGSLQTGFPPPVDEGLATGSGSSATFPRGLTGAKTAAQHNIAKLRRDGVIVGRVRVIQSYMPNAYQHDMLCLQIGEEIDVISKNVSGMWTGILNGRTGSFKFTYVEHINDDIGYSDEQELQLGAESREFRFSSDMTLKDVLERELDKSDDLTYESLHPETRPPTRDENTDSEGGEHEPIYGNSEVDYRKDEEHNSKDPPKLSHGSGAKGDTIPTIYEQLVIPSRRVSREPRVDGDDETNESGKKPPKTIRMIGDVLLGTKLEFMISLLISNGFETAEDLKNMQNFAIEIVTQNANTRSLLTQFRDSLQDEDVYETLT